MKKPIALFLVAVFALILAGCVQPEEQYCADPTSGAQLGLAEAAQIAYANSECKAVGQFSNTSNCNPNSGTWWFGLETNQTGCAAACAINVVNRTAEINWMCTGLLPEDESETPGSDRNEHGCIPSAGYTWCNVTQKCYKSWEENCTTGVGGTGPKAQFRKGPYLLFPGNDNSMTVLWQTDKTPADAKIIWGKTTQYEGGQATVQESGDHQFSYTICGLEAGTLYDYTVSVDGTSQEGSFNTAPPNDAASLTFYAYGDTRSNPAENDNSAMERDKIAMQILRFVAANPAEHQTIVLHTGDYVARGLTENFWDDEYFNRSSRNSMKVMAQLPILGAIGNHETYAKGGSGEDQAHAGDLFRKYWPNPLFADQGCFYYSFDYGPAHFTALDQYKCDYANGANNMHGLRKTLRQRRNAGKSFSSTLLPGLLPIMIILQTLKVFQSRRK
jgi:hypothetical protein